MTWPIAPPQEKRHRPRLERRQGQLLTLTLTVLLQTAHISTAPRGPFIIGGTPQHHSFTYAFIHSWWGEHDLSSPSPPPASPEGGLVSPSGVLTERATDAPCEHEDGRPQAPREAGPADTWISDFRPPGLGDDNLLSFNPLV